MINQPIVSNQKPIPPNLLEPTTTIKFQKISDQSFKLIISHEDKESVNFDNGKVKYEDDMIYIDMPSDYTPDPPTPVPKK